MGILPARRVEASHDLEGRVTDVLDELLSMVGTSLHASFEGRFRRSRSTELEVRFEHDLDEVLQGRDAFRMTPHRRHKSFECRDFSGDRGLCGWVCATRQRKSNTQ
jgi:hypothetical protein